MSKKQIMGVISFSYDTLRMPLEVAHKIQALIAENAIRVEQVYCTGDNPTIYATRPYIAGDVRVAKEDTIDCSAMNNNIFSEWSKAVRERPEGAPIMDPADFAALRRETP
jgi:hypothetical protein